GGRQGAAPRQSEPRGQRQSSGTWYARGRSATRPRTRRRRRAKRSNRTEILQMNPKPAPMFAFPGPLARQTRGADRYRHLGSPNGRVADLAIFPGIWTHSFCRLMHDIERLTLALVVAAAVAPR